MPLYMDRHDLPGVTAEQVAQAHALDLGPAAKHGVELLAYWFDADRGEVFCFAKALPRGTWKHSTGKHTAWCRTRSSPCRRTTSFGFSGRSMIPPRWHQPVSNRPLH